MTGRSTSSSWTIPTPTSNSSGADGISTSTIGVEDIHATFQRIERAGAKIVEGITDRPWGTTEFVIEDPDGHTIYFGSERSEAAEGG